MSGTTKFLMAEQVLFRYYGGFYDKSGPVQMTDVYKAIEQKVNSTFKIRHIDTTLPSGETIPENTMIATYENVAVTSTGNGKATATLPIIPISLPKSMGIYLIYDPNHPDNFYVPIQRGQTALLKTDTLLNDLIGDIGYEPKNNTIVFQKDITTFGVSNVTMELCVFDISQYSETEPLPIPADMEDKIVNELVAQFMPVNPETGLVNNYTTVDQQIPKK